MNRAALLSRPRFRTGDYTVTRRAAPTYDGDGVAVPASATTFTTGDASLQPASGASLKLLPEGTHAEGVRDLWTTAALQVQPVADVVTVDGEPWAVVQVRRWDGMGGTHYIATLSRQRTP